MNNDKNYRYQLESRKLTKKAVRKTACPSCCRKKCFVRYVDTRPIPTSSTSCSASHK